MSTATKAAVAAGSVAGGALGGAALGGAFNSSSSKQLTTSVTTPQDNTKPQTLAPTPESKQPQPQDPDWKPLSLEITTSGNTYDNKIGKEYPHLLVGPYGGEGNYNKGWWDKQFTKYNSDKASNSSTLSPDFANGTITVSYKASSDQESKSLNKVCDSIYKKPKTDIASPSSDEKTKLIDNLWKYCSPLGTKPQTVQEAPLDNAAYDTNAFGNNKKGELLSVKENVNDILWALKQKEFYSLNEVKDEFFKSLLEDKTKVDKKNELKNKCKEAYTKTAANGKTAPSEEHTVNYCSLKPMPKTS